jgi:hypothetical protein
MGSRPKLQRLIRTLKALATDKVGEHAEPIDFVVLRIAQGQTVTTMAREVAEAMGESASRSWLSWRINHLTPDAKERIAGARHVAGVVATSPSGKFGTDIVPPRSATEPTSLRTPVQVDADNDNTGRPRGSVPAPQ